MVKKKQTPNAADGEKQALEAKIDAMMDASDSKETSASVDEPLDIFAGAEPPIDEPQPVAPGAPLLPGKKPKVTAVPTPEAPSAQPVERAVSEPEAVQSPADPAPAAKETPEVIEVQPLNIDTPQTDAAIADIVAQEADEVLAAQDAGIEAATIVAQPQESAPKKHGHPIFWFIILLLVIVALLSAYVFMKPDLNLPFGA